MCLFGKLDITIYDAVCCWGDLVGRWVAYKFFLIFLAQFLLQRAADLGSGLEGHGEGAVAPENGAPVEEVVALGDEAVEVHLRAGGGSALTASESQAFLDGDVESRDVDGHGVSAVIVADARETAPLNLEIAPVFTDSEDDARSLGFRRRPVVEEGSAVQIRADFPLAVRLCRPCDDSRGYHGGDNKKFYAVEESV